MAGMGWMKQQIRKLAEATYYDEGFLWAMWKDLREDSEEDIFDDFEYFKGVTLELDW